MNNSEESTKTMFCPNCGQKIPANVQFCPNCGADLTAGLEQKQAPASQQAVDLNPKTTVTPHTQTQPGHQNATQQGATHQTHIRDSHNSKAPLDKFALTGVIVGSISLFISSMGIFGLIAVIFSIIALTHHLEGTNKVIAIIGLVSGIINLIWALMLVVYGY